MPDTAGDTDPEIIRLAQLIEISRHEIEVRRAEIAAKLAAEEVRKAAVLTASEAKISAATRPRKRRAGEFPDHFNLKLRVGDRERFDEYSYRHRMMKGEVFGRMLDAIEALERAGEGGSDARKK